LKTLIVPAAGKSSRFPNMRPKWLLSHPDGQLMIEKSVGCMLPHGFDRTVITILESHCKKHDADLILRQVFEGSVDIHILKEESSSASETVYRTLVDLGITEHICIKDSDCWVEFNSAKNDSYIVGLEINQDSKIENLQSKSFLIFNSDNIINDIVEKKLASNTVCTGVYSVDSVAFKEGYEEITQSPIFDNNTELYVSHIISYLIKNKNKIFERVSASSLKDWGTLEDWEKEQRKFKTYFFDIDGVFLHNVGKYGERTWEKTFEPIEENFSFLKKLSDGGAEIIFVTAREEKYLNKFRKTLCDFGIKYKTIISGCNHAQRILVNDFAPTNPYPSCKAISIPRNSLIEPYIS
jgi:hypothetical protein